MRVLASLGIAALVAGSAAALTTRQVDELALLGRVWGFVKYHHPRAASGELDLDAELLGLLPECLEAEDDNQCQASLVDWIENIGVPDSCDPCATAPLDAQLLPAIEWIHDETLLGSELAGRLARLHEFRFSGSSQLYVTQVEQVKNPEFENEFSYPRQRPPDWSLRLVSLFRLWNVIEYWFPYRDQIEDSWVDALTEFVPRFFAAETWEEYILEIFALLVRVGDGHSFYNSENALRPPQGSCYWPAALRFVEDQLVVVGLDARALAPIPGLQLGDVILGVDGRSTAALIEERAPYYPASNPVSRDAQLARWFSRGDCIESLVEIERGGEILQLEIARARNDRPVAPHHDRPGEAFQLLTPEVAYLKLSSFRAADVDEYLQRAAGTSAWIVDIRNYPSEFAVFALGAHFVQARTEFARFTQGDLSNPGAFNWTEPIALEPEAPYYKGKLVILVDEDSASQSEYTAMAFRARPGAVVIGSTTAGADGNVSKLPLPGGITIYFSGIGVFYPDKTPTQRVGIVPDIVALPTVEGIREGRDEVLEVALRHVLGPEVGEDSIREWARRN